MVENKSTRIDNLVLGAIQEIVSTPKRDSASTIDVAQKLKLPLQEVKLSFLNLAEKGIIDFDDSVQCAKPTVNGSLIIGEEIGNEKNKDNGLMKNISKIIIGAIVTAIISFLLWYFGLSPNSTNILPFTFGNPVQIYSSHYDDGFYDLVWSYWNVDDVNGMIEYFSQDNQISQYVNSLSNATKVSINGFVALSFDVENSAKFSQANMVEIIIEARYESISQLAEIYQLPPSQRGGAGYPMGYEATIDFDLSESAIDIQTFLANPGPGQDFEFITLTPGERETIIVNITLPVPGYYLLTPVAKFRYEGKDYKYRFDTLEVLFPQKYHVWFVSDGGRGILSSYPFTVGRVDNGLIIENLIQQPYSEILSFNSSLGALNAFYTRYCKSFIINGENVTSSSYADNECKLNNTIPKYLINPEIQTLIADKYNKDYSDVAISPNEDNLAIVFVNESEQHNYFRSGNIVIFNRATSESTDIDSTAGKCDSPVWSPSGRYLAFLCRPDNVLDPTEMWIKVINGKAYSVQLDPNHQYQDPNWSNDEGKILLGGDGLWIISTVSPYKIIQVFDLLDCYLCIENPGWEPNQ